MTRSIITRRAAVGGFALLALSGCGFLPGEKKDDKTQDGDDTTEDDRTDDGDDDTSDGGGENGEDDTDTAEETEDDETEDEDDADQAGTAAGAPGAEVPIGESFTDPDIGDEFTLLSARRDNPTKIDAGYVEDGGEVVYLQCEFTPTGEWGGALSTQEFYIVVDGVEDRAKSGLNSEISDAGLTPMDVPARADGASGPLWMGFTAERRQETYRAAYIRPATDVIGEDRTLPEFRYDFEIPAA
ncbi:hypothetical protein [Brachybacterium fresconis]|uniref:Secreted protein n=1 Tax=Brachybacterium fresconis TaxID=173363 RepID=A0ABS4YKJ2_9MICO|nr:hypothetical protein [Brachybacterium fresconis]MBP2409322.1 hypothetical protein [Brachybacterium fresconis]